MFQATRSSESGQGSETAEFSFRSEQQDDKFHDHHLNQLPLKLLRKLQQLTRAERAWFKTITTPTTRKNGTYEPLSNFLTSLSKRIYNELPVHVRQNVTKLGFLPNGKTPMTCHPDKDLFITKYAPDIIGIEGQKKQFSKPDAAHGYGAIPYHRAFTVAEVNPGSNLKCGTHHAISCTRLQLAARPDLPGSYCLAANLTAYTVSWVDASGAVSSLPWLWHNQDEDRGTEGSQDSQDSPDDSAVEAESEVDEDLDEDDGREDEADEDVDTDVNGAELEEEVEGEDFDEDILRGNFGQSVRDLREDVREGSEDERGEPSNETAQSDEDSDAGVQSGLRMLFGYLYSLYVPKSGHFLKDKTIALCRQPKVQTCSPPTWNIKCGGKTYNKCKLLICYVPWGRRTAIFEHVEGCRRTIIKDYWVDVNGRFKELEALKRIHSGGIMPGVVRDAASDYVADDEGVPLATARQPPRSRAGNNVARRQRVRIVFTSVGEKLQEVRSLKELLHVFFDLNEVHRALLHQGQGILHRDISSSNILIRPTHQGTGRRAPVYNERPKFIFDILDSPNRTTKRTEDTSQCLLIDFDNSALLTPSSADGASVAGELVQQTGTPMFIARAVSSGHRLGYAEEHRRFVPMPVLDGKAKDLYEKTWGLDIYDQYCDNADTCHGAHVPPDEVLSGRYESDPKRPVVHQPRHDVESMFWSLYVTSIQLVPKGSVPDAITGSFVNTWKFLKEHKIGDPDLQGEDIRDFVLNRVDGISRVLHPRLSKSPLQPLLRALGKQISPAYDLLDEAQINPSIQPENLHEAMRRLLLKAIVEMEDQPEIEFDTTKTRTPYYLNKKRGRTGDDADEPVRKRSRTTPRTGEGSH